MSRFIVGDLVVYPAQGVTEIVAVETREVSGIQHVFYVLKVKGTEKKILVPIGKEDRVGLRPVMDQSMIEQLFELMRNREIAFEHETWNRRSRRYMDKIGSGDPLQLAEVYRDFSVLKGRKVLSFGEKKMWEMSRALLVQELGTALNTTEEDATVQMDGCFSDITPFSTES